MSEQPKPKGALLYGPAVGGFTLVELIVVLLVAAVLAAVGAPRFFQHQAFAEMGYADELAQALRFAQKMALTSHCDTRVVIGAGGYQLNQRGSCASGPFTQPVLLPGSSSGGFSGAAPNGVVLSSLDLYFDATGRPRDTATSALLTVASNVAIGSRSLMVEPETGFVHQP